MSPGVHAIQGIVSGTALYPFIGANAIPFGLAVFFIDLDHIILYVADTGDFSPKGFFVYHDVLVRNLHSDFLGLCLFHTAECYILLLLLGSLHPSFYYILLGALFHHLVDTADLIRKRHPFARAYSVLEYFLRRKRHVTSLRQMAQQFPIDTDGIRDIDIWLARWDIQKAGRGVPSLD